MSSGWLPEINEILALNESSMKLHRLHTEASYWHEENDECRVPKMPGKRHSGNCLRDCMQTVCSVGAVLLRLSNKSSKKLTWTPCIHAPASPAIALQCQAHWPSKFQRVATRLEELKWNFQATNSDKKKDKKKGAELFWEVFFFFVFFGWRWF